MKQTLLLAAMTAAFFMPVTSAFAVSEDECAIWLCLPTGFGEGCGGAKSAFKDRIKKFKPPLPDFASCVVSKDNEDSSQQGSTMTARDGYAAYIPPREECVKWRIRQDERVCVQTEMVPSQVKKNTRCRKDRDNIATPRYCTKTIMYTETFMDGQQYGDTYYFDTAGNSYSEGVTH